MESLAMLPPYAGGLHRASQLRVVFPKSVKRGQTCDMHLCVVKVPVPVKPLRDGEVEDSLPSFLPYEGDGVGLDNFATSS